MGLRVNQQDVLYYQFDTNLAGVVVRTLNTSLGTYPPGWLARNLIKQKEKQVIKLLIPKRSLSANELKATA